MLEQSKIWIEYLAVAVEIAAALVIALEFALAADILRTAIAPSWRDIGQLAAIATLRTALNFFLEREIDREELRFIHRPTEQKAVTGL